MAKKKGRSAKATKRESAPIGHQVAINNTKNELIDWMIDRGVLDPEEEDLLYDLIDFIMEKLYQLRGTSVK
jgi:hypothetical protein